MRFSSFSLVLLGLNSLPILACSTSSESASSNANGAKTGSCGLAFYPSDYDTSCQASLDDACCSQEQACAANADCVKLVQCIDACPAPRTDACVHACSSQGNATPGLNELEAIADCSKGTGSAPPHALDASTASAQACDWPN